MVVAATRSIAEHMQRAEELETLHRAANRAGEGRAHLLATASQDCGHRSIPSSDMRRC